MFRNLEVGVLHHVLDGVRIANLDRLQKLVDEVVPQELLVVDQVVRDEVGIVDGGVDKRSLVAVRAKHDRDLLIMTRVQQFLRGLVLRIELLCPLGLRARDAASETHPASLPVLLHVVSVTVSCF